MIWSYFIIFALVSVVLWATGAWAAWRNRRALAFATTGFGLAIFLCLHPYYVDNSGASTAPYDGRDASLVQFLPSFGRRHCL